MPRRLLTNGPIQPPNSPCFMAYGRAVMWVVKWPCSKWRQPSFLPRLNAKVSLQRSAFLIARLVRPMLPWANSSWAAAPRTGASALQQELKSESLYQYGQDIGATALCYFCWALWQLGYVDQATEVAAEAVKHAELLVSSPYTSVYHLPCPRHDGYLSSLPGQYALLCAAS